MVVGDNKRSNIMDGIENTGDVRLHDHRLRLKQRFDIVRKLGQGTYGKVQLGINKKTGQEVAIKTIKKCKIESEADLIRIRREVQIMSSVRHPNIVHIYEVFENSEKMILVMEYCSGGELYDYLSQKKVLQEDEARRLFRQIATAVYYCHIHKICHRDLKLENVLLDDTGSAKIADFGLSNVFKETSLLSTFCGSPLYASPEIVKGTPYIGPEVDCWSLGVLLYTLVYGAMPFDGSNFKRLVRQISNGDYYEPKNPSSASPLIRDMLTVDPLKRADITYICDHPWVNTGCETSCLEMSEMLAAETPVRLDLLLSLAPAAPSHCNSVVVPSEAELGPEESCTDLTNSTSMAVEPSNSAEKRILELVAEGGEDAIKPSPTRTIVSAGENKRKLDIAMSASGLQRKKERVASCASIAPQSPVLPEEGPPESPPPEPSAPEPAQPTLKSSATMTITPAPIELAKDATVEIVKPPPDAAREDTRDKPKPRTVTKKIKSSPSKEEKVSPDKQDEPKAEETKPSSVASATDKMTGLSIAPTTAPATTPAKPKKLSIPGGNVGSFKEQFERRASLTAAPDVKRNVSKPVVSKIAKPKAQSEDRELSTKTPENNGTVRLQQIGIEPTPTPVEEPNRIGVKKTESEPSHSSTSMDPSVLLQDARRSLQNSMAKLVEEKASEESRRRAARDIISSAIRTGKPPVPYGRSSSAGVASLASPPGTPPAASLASPVTSPPRVFRTEAQHRVEDHRNSAPRGVSVERIIPIHMSPEDGGAEAPAKAAPAPVQPATHAPTPALRTPLRRLASTESGPPSASSDTCSSPGEPIKKSAREFIIPIAVEGKGYVTPRQRSLEPEASTHSARLNRVAKPRRISSLVSGGESEEEDDTHMHRLRSSRAARAESVSSGEEDEEDEGFHLLTAENLFSTLLHRVRALTQRLNGEEGPGFPQSSHSLFNNLQSPFFNSPHLPRRNLLREGWGSRDMHAPFDSMFSKRAHTPRGNTKKSGKQQTKSEPNAEQTAAPGGLDLSDLDLSAIQFSEKEMRALSGLTPALSRRLQQQLLAHLPPAAARTLRRTLSLHSAPPAAAPATPATQRAYTRSHSAGKTLETDAPVAAAERESDRSAADPLLEDSRKEEGAERPPSPESHPQGTDAVAGDEPVELPAPQFCTLPRIRRRPSVPKDSVSPPSAASEAGAEGAGRLGALGGETGGSRGGSVRSTPDRPLLSKYLTPERTLSLDESYSSDGGSILSEPSYIAAYGSPAGGAAALGFRRHSMRLAGNQPRRRVSRFLRSDFFDPAPDESVYAKHRKEKELETQKILKEIREKKNRSLESSGVRSPVDARDVPVVYKDDSSCLRKCLSPVGNLIGKDRSRSTTPFFPILDNIKETNLDGPVAVSEPKSDSKLHVKINETKPRSQRDEPLSKESKMVRPRSYPVKNLESFEENKSTVADKALNKDNEADERKIPRESKLIRPKSYPTSSPSPEKVYVNRNIKKEIKNSSTKEDSSSPESKNDIEVSFSITLPKKLKTSVPESDKKVEPVDQREYSKNDCISKVSENASNLTLKKYKILNTDDNEGLNVKYQKNEFEGAVGNGVIRENVNKSEDESKIKVAKSNGIKNEDNIKTMESESNEKKGTIKKKIIKKVSSKSKTDLGDVQEGAEPKKAVEKKKITKKVKDKTAEDSGKTSVPKKKSVLQSIGHKLEKLASSKSSSPEKSSHNNIASNECKKDSTKMTRAQREQSVPVNTDPPNESNLIKRAVTITDVAALENQNTSNNKTTVSKVLGLFKKFDSKEKVSKASLEKSQSVEVNEVSNDRKDSLVESLIENDKDKLKRPTSLLLNGLGRKNKYGKSANDNSSVNYLDNEEPPVLKKDIESKNIRNSLKLDFSRLPRVKKIVPTNPVIEPQIMNISVVDKETENKHIPEKNGTIPDGNVKVDVVEHSRSRSRSRSTYSNSDVRSENSAEIKYLDKNPFISTEISVHSPLRNHESTSPEKEDIVDRIRRKSFYSRFNEKKQRRKSSLVGPGATEYDPLARIHSPPTETKFDVSPTSPGIYDLSPGYSVASDLSPSTDRYRTLLTDLPISTRSNLRYDGLNDKIDTYRSLDRNDFRKYPGSRSYVDYDQPLSYGSRYARTKSLLDSADGSDEHSFTSLREPHKYNRTNSLYTPGSYATYRPKRTLNSAIILKGEKEPSPENILDKIRQRKLSISVTRKPDSEKDPLPRSTVPSKGEGDGAERSEKID